MSGHGRRVLAGLFVALAVLTSLLGCTRTVDGTPALAGSGGVPRNDDSERQYPNLLKECEVLTEDILAKTVGAKRVDDGYEPGAVMGPLIDMKAIEKVEAHIADAASNKAPRSSPTPSGRPKRQFFEPTAATDVANDMVITMEETFGPVPRLHRFKSEEDVITSSRVVTERTTRGAQRLTS